MPSWPMEMPSDTAIVMNSSGNPPAARTPTLARLASRSSGMLQGVTSFQLLATPTWGFVQSSSVIPTARSMARAGARSYPDVTSRLRRSMASMVAQVGRRDSFTLVAVDLRQRLADELEAARSRSLDLLAPGGRRRPAAPAVADHVAAGLGPGPRRQLRGAVAAAGGGRGGPDRRQPRRPLRRLPPPPAQPSGPAAARAPPRPAATSPTCGAGPSTAWRVSTSTGTAAARPLLAGGFVYGMIVQHEHQHDETMLATLQLKDGEGYRPLAPPPPASTAAWRARCSSPPGRS